MDSPVRNGIALVPAGVPVTTATSSTLAVMTLPAFTARGFWTRVVVFGASAEAEISWLPRVALPDAELIEATATGLRDLRQTFRP
jgi:hypothetical protein